MSADARGTPGDLVHARLQLEVYARDLRDAIVREREPVSATSSRSRCSSVAASRHAPSARIRPTQRCSASSRPRSAAPMLT